VLNAAPAIALPAALLNAIDVLIANEHEAERSRRIAACPRRPKRLPSRMQQRFRCATVVTLGARGAVAALPGKLLHAAAPEVDVVDTTGQATLRRCARRGARPRRPWPRALAEESCRLARVHSSRRSARATANARRR
jgi:ribokinase